MPLPEWASDSAANAVEESIPPPVVIRRSILFPAVIAYLALLLGQLAWAARCFPKPEELFHGPAVLVYHAAQAMRGESIYSDWRQEPHVATVYGPLSYLLPAWMGQAIGVDAADLYQVGRAISLLAVLGIGIVVYKLSRAMGAARFLAWLAVLATLASPAYWTVGGEIRPEPMATLCSLLAIWWFLRFDGRACRWEAILFILLGFLFKQSAVLSLLAIVIHLWAARRRREAAILTGTTLAGLGLLILGLNAITHGLYWQNAFGALHGNRTWGNLLIWVIAVMPVNLAPYAFSAGWLWRVRRTRSLGLLEAYFGVSLMIPLVMTWRDGAAEYYFMESIAVASVLMAAYWQTKLREASVYQSRQRLRLVAWLPAAVALAALFQLEPTLPQRIREVVNLPRLAVEERTQFREQLAVFDAMPQPVLSEVDTLTALGCHLPVMLDTWLFSGLIDQGAFNDQELCKSLATGHFARVLLRLPVDSVRRYGSTTYIPRKWLRIIAEHYELTDRLGEHFVYAPKRQ